MGLTKQEMFERAVRGLASQGWEQSQDPDNGQCLYATVAEDGLVLRRCAPGASPPDGTAGHESMTVIDLRAHRIGVAAELSDEDAVFAQELQQVHDGQGSRAPAIEMRRAYAKFGYHHGLKWPEDVQ